LNQNVLTPGAIYNLPDKIEQNNFDYFLDLRVIYHDLNFS